MKWIKLFEGFEEDYEKHYGISPYQIEECFYELQDEGWTVDVKFDRRMVPGKGERTIDLGKRTSTFELLPYIEISIYKSGWRRCAGIDPSYILAQLKNSEIYVDCITHLEGVLPSNFSISIDKIELPDVRIIIKISSK